VPSKLIQRKNPEKARDGLRNVYFYGQFVETFIYYRPLLQPGDRIDGPAVIEQEDSTTLVWEDQIARVDAFSNLLVERT
jgi:N-methylhydantoinase A